LLRGHGRFEHAFASDGTQETVEHADGKDRKDRQPPWMPAQPPAASDLRGKANQYALRRRACKES
jgi:hypothetical protein